ncbi:uncharacterized protein LOC143176619, partial [Nomia melanderi]|uniref:uncharacterized protein LOC143176619 n=1 Tax=Nomia melanderi TaxID=2448451 RepID=UPI003FCCB775
SKPNKPKCLACRRAWRMNLYNGNDLGPPGAAKTTDSWGRTHWEALAHESLQQERRRTTRGLENYRFSVSVTQGHEDLAHESVQRDLPRNNRSQENHRLMGPDTQDFLYPPSEVM